MVSSLLLRSGAASLAYLSFIAAPVVASSYTLQDDFSGASFFDNFDFFTGTDPTNGFVNYVNETAAQSSGLITASAGQPAYFGVDSTNTAVSPGRSSVRISSKKAYTHALIISDIVHMPGGICGTWPAHWTLGTGTWPTNGEIDIIEGVNNAKTNLMSLHTSPGCTIAGSNETGTLQTNNCDTTVNYNSGCGVTASTTASYGSGFNSVDGGVYATEWTAQYIRIWFFPRDSIPADITSGTPDPTTWGLPQANLQGSCDIDSKFANHQIIFDTTFCGDYGNADWNNNPTCMALSSTCNSYVAANPSAFADAYWSVNSVKVYQEPESAATSTSSVSLTSVTPVSSVLAPGMGNSTSASSTSYQAATATSAAATATNPSTIGNFKLLGCASSTDAFSSFVQVDNSATMSLEKCTSECTAYSFAGVYNTLCFCANTLDSSTTVSTSATQCKNACPGNLNELCGGDVTSSRLAVRQASNNIRLTLYQNTAVGALVSVVPASLTFGYGMGMASATALTTTVITTTYVDVCTDGSYTTVPYTATIVQCGCVANEGLASIAMATLATSCASCGTNGTASTVTVTVPAAVAAVATASASAASSTAATASVHVTTLANGLVVTGFSASATAATTTKNGTVYYTGGAGKAAGSAGALLAAFAGALIIL